VAKTLKTSKAQIYSDIDLKEVEYYMYSSPFLTKGFCEYILKKCKALNTWGSAVEEHGFNTQDIYFEKELPEIYQNRTNGLKTLIFKQLALTLGVESIPDPYTMFALKYSMDTQKSLNLHNDDSYISCSIKLNDEYEGADLEFPEQGYSNKDLGVGDILLWPASITHRHKSNELLKGEKYSLTIWTKFPEIIPDVNLKMRGLT